jgi:hypothetical protein
MILHMQALRFLLILVLAAVMDVGAPMVPEPVEAAEEVEEVAHGRRWAAPRVEGAARPATPTVTSTTRAHLRRGHRRAPHPGPSPTRKAPPPVAESAVSGEDH